MLRKNEDEIENFSGFLYYLLPIPTIVLLSCVRGILVLRKTSI